MKIHLNYCRQTSDIMGRVKIAKLLLIQDMVIGEPISKKATQRYSN